MCLYVVGAAVSLVVILAQIPGGWAHVAAVAGAAGKLQIFDFSFSPTMEFFSRKYTFWAGLVGGCFLTMASHGTDQLMVQRLLSARDERQSRRALLSSWLVIFVPVQPCFCPSALALFVYYRESASGRAAGPGPHLSGVRVAPSAGGVAGLVIAAILAAAMANLSAALNALASTTRDRFRSAGRKARFGAGTRRSLRWARSMTVVWGIILVAIGMLARHWGSVLESGLSIASVTLGLLLGVFLLGVLTRRVSEWAAIAGSVSRARCRTLCKIRDPHRLDLVCIDRRIRTFAAGYGCLSLVLPRGQSD